VNEEAPVKGESTTTKVKQKEVLVSWLLIKIAYRSFGSSIINNDLNVTLIPKAGRVPLL
jgi:hypothetical protein